ncbi:phage protein NinX family protein [Pseudomonas protegens]|uniref:phage protein NinX family protein n=1 Tax=Pseudomonas protegens TaxID=380021 RepID=UPI0027507137|nr:phage protein NinX family protein [Pseudomonas protegens]MDP9528520.1 DUF2591 family protein [Pseudomonas protegens]
MTDFVEVKTQDLSGVALDWAVAQAQIKAGEITPDSEEHSTGRPYFNCKFGNPSLWGAGREQKGTMNKDTGKPWVIHGPGGGYSPSTDWAQGGPLIDKFEVEILRAGSAIHAKRYGMTNSAGDGETTLIAACRAIVASVHGDTVSVPKELCHE